MPPTADSPERWIALAEVARPHGVRGELRLRLYNEDSELLSDRPQVRLRMSDGSERAAEMTAARRANDALLVRFAGVDDRNAADALRGARVCVLRSSFPPLEEGEFYACDIEGAEVLGPAGRRGTVTALRSMGGVDMLLVRTERGDVEVPLNERFIVALDAAARRVELADEPELWEDLGW